MLSARERSDHTAFVDGGFLYVWGGHQSVAGEQVFFPSDEIWIYDMSSGVWSICAMGGEVPPTLSQTCGCCLNGVMYIFGGSTENGQTNQLYCVNLYDGMLAWREVTDSKGPPPSPRDRHSCWVYADRLIYFGGYGCKQTREVRNSKSFITDEISWVTTGTALFRLWGWNNEVHVFDIKTNTWSEPQTQEDRLMDIHCLDLETWTWTEIVPASVVPMERSWHTLTPSSDSTLFLFGGLSTTGESLSDGWIFDVQTNEWQELQHQHSDKPRLWHSACLGQNSDVIVFGGSCDYTLAMDTISVLRSPSQSHCNDLLIFQIQPLPLTRLCEDCIGRNARTLEDHLSSLPNKIQGKLRKRISFFKTAESRETCNSK